MKSHPNLDRNQAGSETDSESNRIPPKFQPKFIKFSLANAAPLTSKIVADVDGVEFGIALCAVDPHGVRRIRRPMYQLYI